MAKINGVVIPTQLTLAVLKQIKAIVLQRIIDTHRDENAYLCSAVHTVFNDPAIWWDEFLIDTKIDTIFAFCDNDKGQLEWLHPTQRKELRTGEYAARNGRRIMFLNELIRRVRQDA